jgi:hypothetical protein
MVALKKKTKGKYTLWNQFYIRILLNAFECPKMLSNATMDTSPSEIKSSNLLWMLENIQKMRMLQGNNKYKEIVIFFFL